VLGTTLGVLGGLIAAATFAFWLHRMSRVNVPRDFRPVYAVQALALVLGIAAFALGTSTLGGVLGGFAIFGAVVFFGVAAQSFQARKIPAVAVGGPILDFVLPDHEGRPFDLATLRGKPFLLKFFRGHW